MSSNTYFPASEGDRAAWLAHYRSKLPIHGPVCGIGPDEIAATIKDIDLALWLMQTWYPAIQQSAKSATSAKTQILTGGGQEIVALPTLPVFTDPPEMVLPGIVTRLTNQVARIKMSPGYTDAIGLDLGIVATGKAIEYPFPEFTASVEQGSAGQRVRLNFTKHGHDGVWIESRRDGGNWEFLAIDTVKPYLDERPLMVANTPEHREYRMRWWDKGKPNGEFSPPVRVVVGA